MKNLKLCIYLFTLLLLSACKRDVLLKNNFQQNSEYLNLSAIKAFTTLPLNAGREEKLIVANILSAEERTPFIHSYAEKNGYPVWDKIMINLTSKEGLINNPQQTIKSNSTGTQKSSTVDSSNQRGFFIIPLIDTITKEVTAYIACEKKNDSAYIYKTYNKKDLLFTRGLNVEQKNNSRPLLAMFAYMEKQINGKSQISFSGEDKYNFKNVNITHGSLSNPLVNKNSSAILKQASLEQPCRRALLDLFIITYDDGGFDIVMIFSDCLTLPGVTVVSSPRPGTSGGPSTNVVGQINLLYSSPAGNNGDPGVGNMGGSYTGSPTGWSSNPWNVYWGNLITNIPNNPGVPQQLPNEHFVQLTTITAILGLTTEQIAWLSQVENYEKATEILNFLEENEYDAESILSAQIAIEAGKQGLYQSWQEALINELFMALLPIDISPFLATVKNYVKLQMAIEREADPNASSFTLFYRAFNEIIHLGLDIAGFTPVDGPIFDIANGTLYGLQGNWSDASISVAAVLPIGGEIPATARVIKNGRRIVAKILESGTYYFARNSKVLRKALNLGVGNPLIAHHIIPLGKQNHQLLQLAAKAGFDMNTAANGIPVKSITHTGSHDIYSSKVATRMTQKLSSLGTNPSYVDAKGALESLITEIRNWITAHPDSHIDNIQF